MIVVSDTSPITTLLKIGRINLLQQLYKDVLIPPTVRDELSVLHAQLPDFFQVAEVADLGRVKQLLAEIDPGEAEAIVLAKEKHADVLLIDEIEGREVAAREGVRFIGLLGVLIQARQSGHIPSLTALIEQLGAQTTFRLSEEIKTKALKIAGEL
jgi:uncharacterized protein